MPELESECEDEQVNSDHLGDALDFWKGHFIGLLSRQLKRLHVLPMFTNSSGTWTEEMLDLYALLLGVPRYRILQQDIQSCDSKQDREQYFRRPPYDADIFIDPDAGIEPPSGSNAQHVRFAEIGQLLPVGSNRVVLICQHFPQQANWGHHLLERIVQAKPLQGCSAFAYLGVHAGMFFVARNADRLGQCRTCLATALLPVDNRRVTELLP